MDRLGVYGVGVIANVDNGRPRPKFFRERRTEQDKLIEIGEPFRDETAGGTEAPEERSGMDQLGCNSGGGQSFEHHGREPLHTLLAIERVITDQQNHCSVRRRSPAGVNDPQKPSGVEDV